MTSATAGVIKFLSGELDAARDAAQKARVVNEQCKPMIRNLAMEVARPEGPRHNCA